MKVLLIFALFFSLNANSKSIKDALNLELSRPGFNLLNQTLPQILNGYLNKMDFPDLSLSIPGVGRAIAKDIKFGIEMKSIRLLPQNGYLDIDSVIKNLRIHIGNIRVEDFYTGVVGFNCYKTSIYLANNNDLPFSTKLGLKIQNNKIRVNPRDLKFYLNKDQFKTNGPVKCANLLNPNDVLARIAMVKALKSSRPIINMAIKVIARTYGYLLNNIVNDVVNRFTLPIVIPDILIAPETRILASGFPTRMELTTEGIKINLDVNLRRGHIDGFYSLDKRPYLLKYAHLSLNPELINELLGIIFDGTYTQDLEINSDLNEMISEILTHEQFSMLLPELENIGEGDDQLKMFLAVKSAPHFKIDSTGSKINFLLPDLEMRTQVNMHGKWKDFFHFHHDMGLEMGIEKISDEIIIDAEVLHHKVTGKWARSYSPQDHIFYQDEANEFFPMLVELLLETMKERLRLEIPIIQLGDDAITINDLEIKDGRLHVDIMKFGSF
jgi:hypothetical protein